MDFSRRIALVTGAGRGIGAATAVELAAHGATVILLDRDPQTIEQTTTTIRKTGGSAHPVSCDVSNAAMVATSIEAIAAEHGRIDILINNAGITKDKSALKMTAEHWQAVIDVNLSGAFYVAQATAKVMKTNGYGRIINASSISAWGNFGQANYAAAKAGLIGITRTLALELARYKITVNAIAPGFIATDMTADLPPGAMKTALERIPMGRVGTPSDIARGYLFLACEESGFITGQVLVIDGGRQLV